LQDRISRIIAVDVVAIHNDAIHNDAIHNDIADVDADAQRNRG
jgi:hypothetical protein